MTALDLLPRLREDAGRRPLFADPVATDEDVAAAVRPTFSDDEGVPLVVDASDVVASLVDPVHVPGRVEAFAAGAGAARLDARVLRLLPTRVRAEGALLLPVPPARLRRRGPLGAYATTASAIHLPASGTYTAVAALADRSGTADLRVPEHLSRAVVLHALATLFESRNEGRAVTARNAFLRAVAPYRPAGERGTPVAPPDAAPDAP